VYIEAYISGTETISVLSLVPSSEGGNIMVFWDGTHFSERHNNSVFLLLMCWHNGHKDNYRGSTGKVKNTPNNKLQIKTHRRDNKKNPYLVYLLK
jgi:hypothetical protein